MGGIRLYGYPGDGINGIIGALQRSGKIDFIQVRHEENAALMACAHAKFMGEPGVCLATSGPGAPDFSYAGFAEAIGLRGIRVDTPERVGPAWDEALHADRPVVYDAVVNADAATLPPHVTFEQVSKFARALLKGDSQASGAILESLKGVLAGILPGGERGARADAGR